MGWNSGYSIFESTVVGAYDLGKLDEALLAVLMEPYRGTDIDSGGEKGLKSKDGLDVVDIVLKVRGVEIPPAPDLPIDYQTWTDEQWQTSEDWYETRSEASSRITDEFEWR
jgi:hypothetical protein